MGLTCDRRTPPPGPCPFCGRRFIDGVFCRISLFLNWEIPPGPDRKWFRVQDTYGVEVAPGHDDALILAITAAIDRMAH